jgi:hypothetical protein
VKYVARSNVNIRLIFCCSCKTKYLGGRLPFIHHNAVMFFLIRNIVSVSEDCLQSFFQCLVPYLYIHEYVTLSDFGVESHPFREFSIINIPGAYRRLIQKPIDFIWYVKIEV